MKVRLALALVSTLLVSAAATKDPFAGYVAQAPVDCIDPQFAQGPAIYPPNTIIYRRTERILYRTRPIGTCPALRSDSTLIVEIFGGQLCKHDRFRTREPGDIIPGPVCQFDSFVPYRKISR